MVEATTTPCAAVPRGQRRILPLTTRVQRLIDHGHLTVIARQTITLGRRHV